MSLAGGLLLVASGFLLMEGARWWERGVWLLVWAGGAFDLWAARERDLIAESGARPDVITICS